MTLGRKIEKEAMGSLHGGFSVHMNYFLRPVTLCALSVLFLSAPNGTAEILRAQSADRFVDSIGVNVHAHAPYTGQHEVVKTRLGELGVRHVRDGNHRQALRYAVEFYQEFGIKTTFIMGRRVGGKEEWKSPLDLDAIDAELQGIKETSLPATQALEGPNEYDIHSDKRDPNWTQTLRDYQQRFFAKVKADPLLKDLPVIAPSLTSPEAYAAVGDLDASIDRSCVHLYQSTRHPGTPGWGANGYGSIHWTLETNIARQSPTRKPVWSTECGYNSDLPEQVEAKYLPRMFAEFFRAGFERSFKYELLGKQWGLLREDGTPRPAFHTLRSLITLLKDPGAEFRPATLDIDLRTAVKDVHTLLLQKRDGTFFLMVWRESSSWDVDRKKEITVTPASVTIAGPASAGALLHSFQDEKLTATALPPDEAGAIQLKVADQLMIVELPGTAE